MDVRECATLLSIETKLVFLEAHRLYGGVWHGNPERDHEQWQRWGKGFVPMYVLQYLSHAAHFKAREREEQPFLPFPDALIAYAPKRSDR